MATGYPPMEIKEKDRGYKCENVEESKRRNKPRHPNDFFLLNKKKREADYPKEKVSY
jgi:hypothetical protein